MQLINLNQDNYKNIKNKSIYLYEKSFSYIMELEQEYGILGNVRGIFDTSSDNQEELNILEYTIPVLPIEKIKDLDMSISAIIITSDYFNEAFDKIKQLICNNILDEVFFYANRETRIDLLYRKRYADVPLGDIILFRSGPHASSYVNGMDFSDNARALFEYMLSAGYNERYEIVWLVKNPDDFTKSGGKHYKYTQKYKNISFIGYDWADSDDKSKQDQYYRVLCLAKYIFFTDAYGFARNSRKDQVRVQLWHGCGFKTRVNFVRCEKRYEYTTVISELYSKIHQEIYGLKENQMLVTGYAKQDWLFDRHVDYLNHLGVPMADRYVFWLPTFRMAKAGLENLNQYEYQNQTGLPIIDTIEKFIEINSYLKDRNMVLIVKLHPFQDKSNIKSIDLSNIVMIDNDILFDSDIQINQLLGCADALISDYSSVAVDYMLLDRPIGFTLDDVDEYKNSRGFVFDNILDWLPGDELYDFDEFCAFLDMVYRQEDYGIDKRHKLMKVMHRYNDNGSCKRIVEALKI